MKNFLSSVGGKVLEPDWEEHLDAFKSSAVEYFRECSHIGKFKNQAFDLRIKINLRIDICSYVGPLQRFHAQNWSKSWSRRQ